MYSFVEDARLANLAAVFTSLAGTILTQAITALPLV